MIQKSLQLSLRTFYVGKHRNQENKVSGNVEGRMTIRVINVYSYSAVENRIYEGQNSQARLEWGWELMLDYSYAVTYTYVGVCSWLWTCSWL